HVDGFRFDLAATLCRENGDFKANSAFIKCIYQDPIVSHVKLIAEPWDLGTGGYQAGNFPSPWREWNDRFREDVRRYWRGERGWAGAVATRLAGSSDRFHSRGPLASINYITSHDGMTLSDVVSYANKHNLANGEQNRDGAGCDFSANHGHEGPTDDPAIQQLRARQAKNLVATLLLAQGVPMLQAGDELGRTQAGNNNAYCHDSRQTWVDWAAADERRHAFVRACISLRRRCRLLHRHQFLSGDAGPHGRDVRWLDCEGRDLVGEMWAQTQALGMWLQGEGNGSEMLVACLNPSSEPVRFPWLSALPGEDWSLALATLPGLSLAAVTDAGEVAAHSLVVLTRGVVDAS
ncbi:MAG: glycogen debranching enzyme GlgX, partial [Nannocystaceae bacterium]